MIEGTKLREFREKIECSVKDTTNRFLWVQLERLIMEIYDTGYEEGYAQRESDQE